MSQMPAIRPRGAQRAMWLKRSSRVAFGHDLKRRNQISGTAAKCLLIDGGHFVEDDASSTLFACTLLRWRSSAATTVVYQVDIGSGDKESGRDR
jgi:hypothetical protein